MLESVLNQVLKAQVTEQVAAENYERTDERQGYRNGTFPLTTRIGTISLESGIGISLLNCFRVINEVKLF